MTSRITRRVVIAAAVTNGRLKLSRPGSSAASRRIVRWPAATSSRSMRKVSARSARAPPSCAAKTSYSTMAMISGTWLSAERSRRYASTLALRAKHSASCRPSVRPTAVIGWKCPTASPTSVSPGRP